MRTEVVHDTLGTGGERRNRFYEPWIITDSPCVPINVGDHSANSIHYLVVTAPDEYFRNIRRRGDVAKVKDEDGLGALFDVGAVSDMAGYDPTSSTPPDDWPDFSRPIETEFCCPRCEYEWRGNPRPGAQDVEQATT